MTLLITGAAGFIGSNFIHYYLYKYNNEKIIGLDKLTYAGNLDNFSKLGENQRKRFKFIKGDINSKKLLKKIFNENMVETVINFAAESHVDRSIDSSTPFIETNILGTHTLLETCKEFWYSNETWLEEKKFLQVSTDEVYGSLGPFGYFTEKSPLDPHSPYSASKASADFIVKSFYDTYKMPINITRCSNNYGPYQFPEKLIPLMIVNALNHKPLPVYGDGKYIRDWLFVKDHCKAIDLVIKYGKNGEVYNIGGHNERENISIVKSIIRILNNKTGDEKISEELIRHVKDRLGHDRRYAIDPSKIMKELNWKPETKFEEGVENTVQWYLDNREWVDNIISGKYLDIKDL